MEKLIMENKGNMSVRDAGKKGGNITKERYGHDFYVGIGKKGGEKHKKICELGRKALAELEKENK
jgi:general stress protein YciG